jgi:hypothetical protein
MLIRALGLWPMVDASDDKIQQGSLLRFLGELVWFPSAALEPYLSWRELDAEHAEATIRAGGISTHGTFSIDASGRVTHFAAQRYFGSGPSAQLQAWEVPMHAWQRFQGIQVPSEGEVTWRGDFAYYRFKIEAIEYDQPHAFGDVPRRLPKHGRAAPLISRND